MYSAFLYRECDLNVMRSPRCHKKLLRIHLTFSLLRKFLANLLRKLATKRTFCYLLQVCCKLSMLIFEFDIENLLKIVLLCGYLFKFFFKANNE